MATIQQLLPRMSIEKYLEAKGTTFARTGSRRKCKCPLPGHPNDKTPSFYLSTAPDGVELFYCFGCNTGGNFITLVRLMEGKPNRQIAREMAQGVGEILDKGTYIQTNEVVGADVMHLFVDEDVLSIQIADYVYSFLEAHQGSDDAMAKANHFYRRVDELAARGDGKGLRELFGAFRKMNSSFGRIRRVRDEEEPHEWPKEDM